MVRTTAPFVSLADARIQYEKVIEALDRHGRSTRFMLADLRNAPGRSDPGFETMMAELRPRMNRGYRRQGVLTKTAAGTLQISRHTKQDGIEILISDNENDIMSFFRIVAKMSR
jgi:hypothetical protein